MEPDSKQLKARLIELRNAIKRKYRAFKEGVLESDLMLERQYKPLIQEIRKSTAVENNPSVKKEKEEVEDMDYDTTDGEDVAIPKEEFSEFYSPPDTKELMEEYFKNPVTRDYMSLFIKDKVGKVKVIDNLYGPRYEDDQNVVLGDKKLDFDTKGNILIGHTNYGSSEGLYELIFKKVPDSNVYNGNDLKAYKSILIATNAHRENNDFNGKVKRNSSTKYIKVIRQLFPTQGKGMAWKSLKSHDVIHWDNVNELVQRLEEIAMSTESGNRVHGNEILSIIEELKEAGYIKGSGNSRFKALLQ